MDRIILKATNREVIGKANKGLLEKGLLPAVVYGHNVKNQSLQVELKEFIKVFKKAGENTLIDLEISGKTQPVIIQDVQNHYLKNGPIHVDFYAVNMEEKIKAHIPVHFIGESIAVKTLGGILVKNLTEIEVECLPGDLPKSFEIDLGVLATFEDAVKISDLKVSDKVKILGNPDEVIINVAPPRSEEELKSLQEQVVEDVTKVEGVVKPEAVEDAEKIQAKEEPSKDK
jgi:large subunit ribosomal protein L25